MARSKKIFSRFPVSRRFNKCLFIVLKIRLGDKLFVLRKIITKKIPQGSSSSRLNPPVLCGTGILARKCQNGFVSGTPFAEMQVTRKTRVRRRPDIFLRSPHKYFHRMVFEDYLSFVCGFNNPAVLVSAMSFNNIQSDFFSSKTQKNSITTFLQKNYFHIF